MVSVILPSRNERFLVPTVRDLLAKATGSIEIIVILDGYWAHDLPSDPRLTILHRGTALGMRPAINAAVQMAHGRYLLKCDAHTMWSQGYDETLVSEYHEDNWILTCRRYALDPEAWAWDTSNPKYPVDAHYLSYPYERSDEKGGLHGTPWTARREQRKDVLLDDEMSSQGSMWFMSRKHWDRLGEMESTKYGNFVNEMQELGLKTWLGGGAMKVTKRTWYAHLYKGKRYGRGYVMGPQGQYQQGFCTPYWMGDQWEQAVRPLRWLIERFAPVPGWPADLDAAFARRAA
jgi:glycosyltransferase involved in cell wall biosynthesis